MGPSATPDRRGAAGTAVIIALREEPAMNDGDCPITSLADAAAVRTSMRGMRSWIATPLVGVIHRFQLGMAKTHDRLQCGKPAEAASHGLASPVTRVACVQVHVPNAMKEYAVERAMESVPTACRASMRASARPDPARRWS